MSRKPKPKLAGSPDGSPAPALTRDAVLAFLSKNDTPAARRDIARALGVKGPDRATLRTILRDLEEEGALAKTGKKRFARPEPLPRVGPLDVMSVDDDGDLLCLPPNWVGDDDPPMIRIPAAKAASQRPTPGVGDRLLARLRPAGDNGYEAEIIKPIGKSAHRFLAVYRTKRGGGVAEPVERRTRSVFLIDREDAGDARDGDLVWVEAKNERGYGPRKARVRRIDGHIDDKNAFSLIALASHGVPLEFPPEVEAEAEAATAPDLGGRDDLRDTPLLTIDPSDAKDHDDAVFAAPDDDPANEGGFRVIVAIADVGWFVRPGSALDREALRRGNSTYLPDRVVPMLPEALSNGLCSLREGEDRPCLAVEMILNPAGRKRRHRFMRAMMRSAAKLSYENAQAIIDGAPGPDETVTQTVRTLHAAYRARLMEREKRAPLDLELPERRVVLNADGEVEKIVLRERFDAHRLIEEFMILANVAAAETLEQKRRTLIYRIHDEPDPEKLDGLREYLETLGYSLVKGPARPAHFNQLLKKAGESDQKELVSDIVLRSQRQAVYATENVGHFGLNLGRYAHFTSPIRRYADLTVHRALISGCSLGEGGQNEAEAGRLAKIAQEISDLERRSMAAEREAVDRYLAAFLSTRIGTTFRGRIRGVTRFGLFVMLEETGADGFAPISSLPFERFRFEERAHALIGETTGARYHLGLHVDVRLLEATPLTGGLRFEILTDPVVVAGAKSASRPGNRRPTGAAGRRPTVKARKKQARTRRPKS